jgi:hypothetical protein
VKSPYRILGEVSPEPERTPPPRALGALRSSHAAKIPTAAPLLHGTALVVASGVVLFRPAYVVATAALLALLGPFLVQAALHVGSPTIQLHDEGLKVIRFGRAKRVFFDDVASVFYRPEHALRGGPLTPYALHTTGGARVVIPRGVVARDVLGRRIDEKCFVPLVTQALMALDEGETLFFGRLMVERDALYVDGERFEWDAVDHVTFGAHDVVVRRPHDLGRIATLSTRDVPHVRVLATVLATRTRTEVDDELFAA